jgi:hypothetical protein
MAGCDPTNRSASFLGLGYEPQLVRRAPAPPALPARDDLHHAIHLATSTAALKCYLKRQATPAQAAFGGGIRGDRGFGRFDFDAVFAAGWAALRERLRGAGPPTTAEPRWQGLPPAKVFCSSVIPEPASRVWAVMRDFADMGGWHPDIADMQMLAGAPADKMGGVLGFRFGEGELEEQLTLLSDPDRRFRYKINRSGNAWLNYHAGACLYDVTAGDGGFAVWTADSIAAAEDDITLIPLVHQEVFQRAFDTLADKLAMR